MLLAESGGGGPFFILLILIAIGVAIYAFRRWRGSDSDGPGTHGSGLAILDERYARGEIERDEYLKRREDLAD